MSAERRSWVVKVIAGPHAGAEMELPAGRAVIGSDPECDVVLHDVLVAPQHMAIELGKSGQVVSPLGGRVYCGGKRVRDSKITVPDFTFITVGGTHLVIGPAAESWPLLSAADVPDLEKEAPEPSPDEEKPEAETALKPEALAPEKPSVSTAQPGETDSARKRRAYVGIAAGLLLFIGWGIAWTKLGPATSPVAVEPKLALRAKAEEVVKRLDPQNALLVEEKGSRVFVSGYVETDAANRNLQTVLRSDAPGVITRIWSMERIATSARGLLSQAGLPLDVRPLADGKIAVSGHVQNPADWARARQMLLSEVPGLTGFEESLQTPAVAVTTPNFSVPNGTMPAATPAGVPATPSGGDLVPAPVSAPAAPAEVQGPSTPDSPDSIVSHIRRRTDGMSWVRLNTGGIYYEGSTLPFGGTVERILEDKIIVVRGTARLEVAAGGSLAGTQISP